MTLSQGHVMFLSHGQQLCEVLSRSNSSCGPHTDFQYVYCDSDLEDITLDQGHDTPLGHGQYVFEILYTSNIEVRSYGRERDFGYMFTMTLTMKIWPRVNVIIHPWVMDNILTLRKLPWFKVMTHPWVMDNTCAKYYLDPTWQWGVMVRTRNLGMCALWPWPLRYDLGSSVLTRPYVMENCVKYYPDPTWQWSYGQNTDFG